MRFAGVTGSALYADAANEKVRSVGKREQHLAVGGAVTLSPEVGKAASSKKHAQALLETSAVERFSFMKWEQVAQGPLIGFTGARKFNLPDNVAKTGRASLGKSLLRMARLRTRPQVPRCQAPGDGDSDESTGKSLSTQKSSYAKFPGNIRYDAHECARLATPEPSPLIINVWPEN